MISSAFLCFCNKAKKCKRSGSGVVENWKNPPLHNSLKSFATQPRNAIGQTMAMQWFEKSSFDVFM